MKVTITLDHTTLLEAIDQYHSATIHATLKPPPLVTAKGDPQR